MLYVYFYMVVVSITYAPCFSCFSKFNTEQLAFTKLFPSIAKPVANFMIIGISDWSYATLWKKKKKKWETFKIFLAVSAILLIV